MNGVFGGYEWRFWQSRLHLRTTLQRHLDIAAATSDIKSMTQLVTAIDRAKKWSAPCQTTVSPFA